jgi:hypothetical protein
MPPPEAKIGRLTPEQVETLKRWIAEGAKYEPHWALVPPGKPAIPAVADATAARHPIDAVVSEKLANRGLAHQPEADRAPLILRASFDITGLPPTPAEVAAFVADTAPDAYEKQVERLLQSPHHGEEMARHWLDAARYADTHGLHLDNERQMWAYRDWVVKAFNDNLPFDQFTIWQLAGDLLPEATLEQKVATGFSRCNVTTSEGGSGKRVGSSTRGGGGDSTVSLMPNTSSSASIRHSAAPRVPVSMPVTRTTIRLTPKRGVTSRGTWVGHLAVRCCCRDNGLRLRARGPR